MATPLYSLKIKSKRDVLLARQRARQLTNLLGYAEGDQLILASAAFELAWTTYQSRGRVALHFTLENDCLRISCARPERKEEEEERRAFDRAWNAGARPKPKRKADAFAELAMRLEKPLPRRADPMPVEDVAWAMEQLAKQTPLNLFEEIRLYNLELLRLASGERGRREEPARAGAAA